MKVTTHVLSRHLLLACALASIAAPLTGEADGPDGLQKAVSAFNDVLSGRVSPTLDRFYHLFGAEHELDAMLMERRCATLKAEYSWVDCEQMDAYRELAPDLSMSPILLELKRRLSCSAVEIESVAEDKRLGMEGLQLIVARCGRHKLEFSRSNDILQRDHDGQLSLTRIDGQSVSQYLGIK